MTIGRPAALAVALALTLPVQAGAQRTAGCGSDLADLAWLAGEWTGSRAGWR